MNLGLEGVPLLLVLLPLCLRLVYFFLEMFVIKRPDPCWGTVLSLASSSKRTQTLCLVADTSISTTVSCCSLPDLSDRVDADPKPPRLTPDGL